MASPRTREGQPRMNTNGHEWVVEDPTREIIGCAMEVLNTLGHGLLEKVYENALCVEMRLRGISYQQQPVTTSSIKRSRLESISPI